MNLKKLLFLIVLVSLTPALFLVSCKNTIPTQTVTPELLKGSWAVDGNADVYQTVQMLDGQEFKIDIDGDGTFDILGYYQLADGKIIFRDKGGFIVPQCHAEGVYVPELRGDQLLYRLIKDECPGRLKAMNRVWRRTV